MTTETRGFGEFRDPIEEKLFENGETVLGVWGGTANEVELAAHLGFDFFSIDQMFTGIDWQKTEELIRTAQSVGISPTIRVQSYPWQGYDRRVVTDASRNMGIGGKYIRISFADSQEITECLDLAYENHRKIGHLYPYGEDSEENELYTYIIPLAETLESLEVMEELCELPEIKIFGLAAGDALPVVTDTEHPDYHDPAWWEFIDEAVKIGEKTDTVIASNVSFHPTEGSTSPYGPYGMEEVANRVVKLHNHGVKKITVQGIPFLCQLAAGEILDDIRNRIPWPN